MTPQGPAMVSSLREAQYYASQGVEDLVYGVGIAPAKLDRVGQIRERNGVNITVILDSIEQAEAIRAWSVGRNLPMSVMIEVDCDGSRSGATLADPALLVGISRVLGSGNVDFRGVITHAGASYSVSNTQGLLRAAEVERQAAVRAAEILEAAGCPCRIVSAGSTPTVCSAGSLAGITEVRAGVYMFGDLVQCGIGTCDIGDIAVSVLATVIGRHRANRWIIIDAGWMALSCDRGTASQSLDQGYGQVCDAAGEPFPDLLVLNANQEHGIVGIRSGSDAGLPDLPIGSRVRILPNHACATCAQHDSYHVLVAGQVEAEWPRVRGW